jgi:hypothetical protein
VGSLQESRGKKKKIHVGAFEEDSIIEKMMKTSRKRRG